MASVSPLAGHLQDEVNEKARIAIRKELWPSSTLKVDAIEYWNPYFGYFEKQAHNALHDQGLHVAARTYQHVVDIVHMFEQDELREDIRPNLRSLCVKMDVDPEILDSSMDLAARLYTMINIGTNDYVVSSQTQLMWGSGTLKRFLAEWFGAPQILNNSNIRFEKTFTAYNMERIAGIKIRWTDNLADHLRMVDEDDKTVAIFHHAFFLSRTTSNLFPAGLIEEVLRTLALLFPQHDSLTQKHLQRLAISSTFDPHIKRCGQLRLGERQIENYRFWHDRLVILKQAYDQSRPSTLSQWWYDRRNGVQWYTFWVAVVVLFLTILFGLVQSIEGALQVYKAYHPTAS
jgi:hypothetical protein